MSRNLKTKELINTRLATNYGGWVYCTNCNKNIGYLCYVTYDSLNFNYECNCGSKGSVLIDFEDSKNNYEKGEELITIKNRLCCPQDESPLITILDKNIKSYNFSISCKNCGKIYERKEV